MAKFFDNFFKVVPGSRMACTHTHTCTKSRADSAKKACRQSHNGVQTQPQPSVDTVELLRAHNQFRASSKLCFQAKTFTLNHPYIFNEEQGNFGDKVTGVEGDQAPYGDVRLISERYCFMFFQIRLSPDPFCSTSALFFQNLHHFD